MERRLFGIAILTFVVELTLFLLDMGWLHIPGYNHDALNNDQVKIGEVMAARQFVRRRGYDSNIWEDSNAREMLFENDSILTLNGSSAKLKLRGDVNLELHENTLVVLEPIEESSQEPFRLRFSRGDVRAQNGEKGLQLKSGEWTISAKPGTDLSVRAVDSHQVEVDVTNGSVDVVHKVSGQTAHIAPSQRLTLLPEEVGELVTASEKVGWLDSRPQRLYAHKFPIQVPLTWRGPASEMEVSSPGHGQTRIPLPSDSDHSTIPLGVGSYHLTLRFQNEVSKALPIEILPAPKFVYLTPLPRDRVQTGSSLLYTWLSEIPLAGYRVDFLKTSGGQENVHQSSSSEAKTTTAIPVSGSLHWQVIGFDEDGFIIPASHSYPIFSVPDPFAPPQLRAPSGDDSAAVEPQRRTRLPRGFVLWSLLMGVAEGKKLPPVIFNWDQLPGADFYMIEISTTEDFLNPIIVAKSSTNYYAWSKFKKGIYYYRVAGGANNGRMGLFTAPTKIDLTIWPLPRTLPPKIKTEVAAPPAPTPMPVPVVESVSEPAPVAAPIVTKVVPQPSTLVGPPVPEIFGQSNGRIWWRGLYRTESQTGPERIETNLAGPTATAVGLEVKSPVSKIPLSISADYASYSWKPKSKTELPFQPKIDSVDWNIAGLWREPYSRWHYGGTLSSKTLYQRASLESISTKNSFATGFVLRYSYIVWQGQMAHEGWILIGKDTLDLRSRNRWHRPLYKNLFLSTEINLNFGMKTYTGTVLESGVGLGLSF